jgi:hypothetical protein
MPARRRLLTRGRIAQGSPSPRLFLFTLVLLALAASLLPPGAAAQIDPEGKVIAQVRVRPELRDNADFDDSRSDRQRFIGQRTRFGVDLKVNPKVEGRVLAQDTRIWGVDEGANTLTTGTEEQSLDLYEGYLDLRWIWDLPLELRLGRQGINFGRQRLVGTVDFANTGRAFDAFKFRFTMGAFMIDILSAKLAETNGPIRPDSTVFSDQDRNFSGAYFAREGNPLERLDLYWLRDIDKRQPVVPGEIKRSTFGLRGRYALPSDLAIEVEYAHQSGEAGDALDISAQMLTSELSWEPADFRELKAVLGFDLTSGDNDANDGDLETWDQLFPTGHAFFGFMDYVGRQNIQDFRGQIGARLWRNIAGTLHYHWFRLHRAEDAWFNVGGVPYRAGDVTFGADPDRRERDLGSEIDLVLRMLDYPGADIEGGFSWFITGDVIDEASSIGDTENSVWGYLQLKVDL